MDIKNKEIRPNSQNGKKSHKVFEWGRTKIRKGLWLKNPKPKNGQIWK